jgi:nucleotide-binding universal stress UspA family protein
MYRNIVLAVDGSSSSKLALKEAVRLAALAQCTVHAIHVVDTAPLLAFADLEPADVADAMRKDGRAVLDEVRRTSALSGVQCHTQLLEKNRVSDEVAEIIQRYVDLVDADIVVMGTHGRAGVGRVVLGSVAESLLRRSQRPVLLVRDNDGSVGTI